MVSPITPPPTSASPTEFPKTFTGATQYGVVLGAQPATVPVPANTTTGPASFGDAATVGAGVGEYARETHTHGLLTPTVRIAAGVPAGTPVSPELPLAVDTTAVTGGIYAWNGAAWVKAATI